MDEIRRTIWQGTIPCRIELDASECKAPRDVDPYFLNIPRTSYLPFFIPQIFKFFQPFMVEEETSKPENAWFEFESVPLKWHWPVGLLYDLFTGHDPSVADNPNENEHQLPWSLVLRFREFPARHLMRLEIPGACHDAWMNAIKEADHVRHGSTKLVMDLSKAESTKLWESLQSHDYDGFWAVNEKLLSHPSGITRSIPVKIYLPSASRVLQHPVSPTQASKEAQTVGTTLQKLLPELFPSQRVFMMARPVVHGVVVAMNTPLLELMHCAVYPDGFVHISVSMMS